MAGRSRLSLRLPLTVLLLLNLLFVLLFQLRNCGLEQYAGCLGQEQCLVLPDGQFNGYSSGELQTFMAKLGEPGRRFYAWSEMTLDLLYPLIYGALLLALLRRVFPLAPWWPTALPVLLIMGLDWTENAVLTGLAVATLPLQPFADYASLATQGKFLLVALVLLVLAGGWVRQRYRGKT